MHAGLQTADRHSTRKVIYGLVVANNHRPGHAPVRFHDATYARTPIRVQTPHPMYHAHLQTVRNALDRLKPPGGKSPPGSRTDPNAVATRPGSLAPITRFDMRTFHSTDGRDTAGCIAGVTITLFPDAARKAAWDLIARRLWRPGRLPVPISRIVAAILDAPHTDVCNLLYPAPRHYALDRITPEQAIAALDRFAAGHAPWPIRPLP